MSGDGRRRGCLPLISLGLNDTGGTTLVDTTLVYSYMYIDILLMTRQSSCQFFIMFGVLRYKLNDGMGPVIFLWYAGLNATGGGFLYLW